jgi:hypothetical protein
MSIAHFGTIKIARDGVVSVEQSSTPASQGHWLGSTDDSSGFGSVHVADTFAGLGPDQLAAYQPLPFEHRSTEPKPSSKYTNKPKPPPEPRPVQTESSDLKTFQPVPPINDASFLAQEDLYPDMVAGMNDWAFQGVDNAFFDNLLKGSSFPMGNGAVSADWAPNWQGDLN